MSQLDPDAIVSFFVAAHPDDWQLFRGDQAWDDVIAGGKVVFVYVSAGDDGQGKRFWLAREAAAMASVELLTGQTSSQGTTSCFNGKPIMSYRSALTRSYFLRLPDGSFCHPGQGYKRNRYESLTRLRTEGRPLSTVDGSASYGSWRELVETLGAILDAETQSSADATPRINTSSRDRRANPNDHFDHYEVGELIEAYAPGRTNVSRWSGYENRTRRVSLAALERKRALMRAYRRTMKIRLRRYDVTKAEKHDEWFMSFEGE